MDELVGYLDHIIFSNEENGFTVGRFKEEKEKKEICIVGAMPGVKPGESLLLGGEWITHPTYGKQFSVKSYSVKEPCDVHAIEKYLKSGLVEGIGPVYAEKIVKKFGIDTLKIIDSDPTRLLEVNGIGKKRIKKIISCWSEQRSIREVMLFLRSFDISPAFAQKIYKRYGLDSIRKVKDNPYQLAKDIIGVGFKIADKIAYKMGIDKASEKRIEAGVEFTLWELTNFGHTCFPKGSFVEKASTTLNVEEYDIHPILEEMIGKGSIIQGYVDESSEKYIWLKNLYYFEEEISKSLIQIKTEKKAVRHIELEKALTWVEEKLNLDLEEMQKTAIRKSFLEKMHIITGGPGTGKSTITQAILEIFSMLTSKILLAAPTGKAAKRMTQITRKRAHTIHSLLEFDFVEGKFKKDETNQLNCDLIIIDEASMIDTLLMHYLLKAIPRKTTVIFIGDIDQLPSVGPGYVLKDMIESKVITTTKLTEIFRQAKGSLIVNNAHKINKGEFPVLVDGFDFKYFEEKNPPEILKKILTLVSEDLPKIFHHNLLQAIQVLSPMKKGIIGSENINIELQKILNPSKFPLIQGEKRFHINDKVMQIKNNYNKNIFNGDVGIIENIDFEGKELLVNFDGKQVFYDFLELDELVLAYAVSVHKYQGSECPCIVMPIHTTHFKLLYRNMLYTGITRGKKLVVLIGSKKAIAIAIKNDDVLKRYTGLSSKIIKFSKDEDMAFMPYLHP